MESLILWIGGITWVAFAFLVLIVAAPSRWLFGGPEKAKGPRPPWED